jgi:hypothetical protein
VKLEIINHPKLEDTSFEKANDYFLPGIDRFDACHRRVRELDRALSRKLHPGRPVLQP